MKWGVGYNMEICTDHIKAPLKTNLLKNNKTLPVVSQINQTIAE
jgi:hypothetical protein